MSLVFEGAIVTLKLVPGLHLALKLGVLVGELLSVVDHLLDVHRGQSVLVFGDGDFNASALILGGDDQDTVRVNLKGDLDLWHSSGRGGILEGRTCRADGCSWSWASQPQRPEW